MDHFNVTVQKDGAVVSTRRGLQVSKHKYHGISFVNTTGPQQPASGEGSGGGGRRRRNASLSSTVPRDASAASFGSFSVMTTSKTTATTANPATPATPATPGSTQSSTRGHARRKSRLNDRSAVDAQIKPMVHRWKLNKSTPASTTTTTTTTTQKPLLSTRHTPPDTPTTVSSALPSPLSTSPASHVESHFDSPLLASGSSTASSPQGFFDGLSPGWEVQKENTNHTGQTGQTTQSLTSPRRKRKQSRPPDSHATNAANAANAALAASCRQVARSLPTWSACYVPQLNGAEQRVFHQFFQLIPRKLFPFEDLLQYNPSRSSEFYWMVVQDRAAVRCVLLCGAMFRAVLGGTSISEDLSAEVANVCRIVGQQLARWGGGTGKTTGKTTGNSAVAVVQRRPRVPTMTLECITTLALMGSSTGRYDHWHVHMQALRAMVGADTDDDDPHDDDDDDNDWAAHVRPALLAKMRKTDLKGAMALAIRPYLPFGARRFANASDAVLLAATRDALVQVTTGLLAGLVAPPVAATVADLCVFVQAVQLAAHLAQTPSPLPLDPFCFAEELYWIQHRLVTQPGPLRDLSDAASSAAASAASAAPATPLLLPLDTSRLETDSYVRNHRAPLAAALLVPAPLQPGTTDLEPALRICAMLYLKEYFPDFPRNLGGYAILLHLLRCHLDRLAACTALAHPHARALLLWLCLVGDTVSRRADATEQRVRPAEQYDRRVFRARLHELVQSSTSSSSTDDATAAASLPDSDLALCQLLPIGVLRHQGDAGPWDARQDVARILEEE